MIEIITSKLLSEAGILHGFTGSDDFATPQAFSALQQQMNITAPMFKVTQVHGSTVVITSEMTAVDFIADTAACIGVVTADCVPILLYCRETGLTAAIHAGWKGLSRGVVRNTVRTMFHRGATAKSILCVIGPCICFDCYDVGEDVASLFPESSEPIPGAEGQYFLDLAQAVEVSLIGTGLSTATIERTGICTSCSDRGLHSYRKSKGDCGRQYAFICRK
jgi:YfiH family protein